MSDTDVIGTGARTALRVLYGAAAAHLRAADADVDVDVAALLADGLAAVGAEELLAAGVMSVAEQLRDVAAWRRLDPCWLLRVLRMAHIELAGEVSAVGDVLDAATGYLRCGPGGLAGIRLAGLLEPAPQPALLAVVEVLAAAVRWRAEDQQVPAHELVRRICLGLARRDLATS